MELWQRLSYQEGQRELGLLSLAKTQEDPTFRRCVNTSYGKKSRQKQNILSGVHGQDKTQQAWIEIQKIAIRHKKFFTIREGCTGRLWSPSLEMPKTRWDMALSNLSQSALSRPVGLGALQGCFINSAILWFCNHLWIYDSMKRGSVCTIFNSYLSVWLLFLFFNSYIWTNNNSLMKLFRCYW